MSIKEKIRKIIDLVATDQRKLLDSLSEEERERSVPPSVGRSKTYWCTVPSGGTRFLERLQAAADGQKCK
jgi:hypothetical protein